MKPFKHNPIELTDLSAELIDGKRFYNVPGGKYYPSITSVLSVLSEESIQRWRKRVGEKEANKISTRAARRGTHVHQMCEDYLNNELICSDWNMMKKFLPEERAMFKSLKPELDKNIGTIYSQECALYSDYLGVAGRVDCVAEWEGRLSIIDFKTSSRAKRKHNIHNYFQQAAAYAIMFEERTKIPIDKIVIAIAVEQMPVHPPQIYIEKRDNWVPQLLNTIEKWKEVHSKFTNAKYMKSNIDKYITEAY
jgi:hypothetical protein